ncbi:rho guanine nucleotide exchange factor 5 [Limosa lapponica baueri]|uniref:Rho guanine nucleotide exchange factor 5 n=1 Tax=Limosa lapponica baueri TaxID=1758121 RepID=A0A2I0TE11_LIMLA|nr:rho guanine nucleotide exchange factor 5 [Limosa lapponica baueri]
MLGRPSNPVQKGPAGLEQEQGDAEPQKGLSELEGEMLLEKSGLDCSLKLKQVELVDLESNQDSSSPSAVQDVPASGNDILQAVDLSTEFPQCQAEEALHGSDPQAQHPKSPLADAISSQRETPKCFLVCKTVSEGHYKAEPFLDKISTDSLQEVDPGAEQKQSSNKVAPANDEQPTSEEAVKDVAKPYNSENAKESMRALQALEGNTEYSLSEKTSSHQLSSTLTDDSQVSSLQEEGNISAAETRNSDVVKDQGAVTVPKENSSTSKGLHLEGDHKKPEGQPTAPAEHAFQVKDTAKIIKEVNTTRHKEPAQEEAVSELQQEEKKEECKEQNLTEEGKTLEPKDQKSKEQNEQEQQLQREKLKLEEELKPEALSSAFREKKPADAVENFKRRHSKLINSSRLLYQEYSDVVLNKAIQSQKRVDSFAEDIESSFPSSPRLRRKVLSPQDSYLQRLSVSSTASLWQDIPMIRGSRMLLNMSRDEQKLQEIVYGLSGFQRTEDVSALLNDTGISLFFYGTATMCCSFLFDLEEKFEEDIFTFHVCDVALKHAPEFRRVYLPYVTNQTYQEQTFQRLLILSKGNIYRAYNLLARLFKDVGLATLVAGWMEGVKLSDRERGWFPAEHVEFISSKHARQKNLKEEQRVKNAKQQVFCKK